jgi:hypothetical protein
VGRIVEPDGHFLAVDAYRSDGGGFVIVREMGEPYDAFERRVIEEFHWRALHTSGQCNSFRWAREPI